MNDLVNNWKKRCIFCGEIPRNQTKEHIIPQWLQKIVESKDKKYSDGFRPFHLKTYTCPSCDTCNEKYGKNLESLAKPAMCNLLNNSPLKESDIHVLLSWFDKMRIVLRYNELRKIAQKNEEIAFIDVDNYINKSDRILAIYKTDKNIKTLRWSYPSVYSFILWPSCYFLSINDFYFFYISLDFLVSENLGFPFSVKRYWDPTSSIIDVKGKQNYVPRHSILLGKKKIITPVLKKPLIRSNGILYQLIFNQARDANDKAYNANEYVHKNSYNYELGFGNIFAEKEGKVEKVNESKGFRINEDLIYNRSLLDYCLQFMTIQYHNYLIINYLPKAYKLNTTTRQMVENDYQKMLHYNYLSMIDSVKYLTFT